MLTSHVLPTEILEGSQAVHSSEADNPETAYRSLGTCTSQIILAFPQQSR